MLISIVIPNFNSGPVLERAIQSLLAQNYPDLQLLLIDAVSTDPSREIIERYRHRFDTVIIEKDNGQADAINKGFSHARGEIFGWLCADDELLPGALHHIKAAFAADPSTDVVSGGCERVFADNTRKVIPADSKSWQIVNIQNPIEQSATFWRASPPSQSRSADSAIPSRFRLGFVEPFSASWCQAHHDRADYISLLFLRYQQDRKRRPPLR